MEINFKAPGGQLKFSVDAFIKVEDGRLHCNRVNNKHFLDKVAKSSFEKDGVNISKVWVDDFNIKLTQIKNVIVVGFAQQTIALIMGLLFSVGLSLFSFFTDSFFWWNGGLYFALLIYFVFIFIKGKTTIKLIISPIDTEKSYEFEIVALGNSPELVNYGKDLKNMIEAENK